MPKYYWKYTWNFLKKLEKSWNFVGPEMWEPCVSTDVGDLVETVIEFTESVQCTF